MDINNYIRELTARRMINSINSAYTSTELSNLIVSNPEMISDFKKYITQDLQYITIEQQINRLKGLINGDIQEDVRSKYYHLTLNPSDYGMSEEYYKNELLRLKNDFQDEFPELFIGE